jgi:NAD(P)-dependent dehydrogenase (short-subunit alcohol dehydrogenase family)
MRIIVTGGNSGVGKATAAAAAESGHSVVIACRSIEKAERAAADMPGDVEVAQLDLTDLASVRSFADSVETVDVLVNNAGVMGLPMTRTADGFEAHMGTNHLGHFALTCLLGDKIKDRVISVASAMYHVARIHFDDLNWHTRRYSKTAALLGIQTGEPTLRSRARQPWHPGVRVGSGHDRHRHHERHRCRYTAGRAQSDVALVAHPSPGCAGDPSGGDDRTAQRNVFRAAVQSVG